MEKARSAFAELLLFNNVDEAAVLVLVLRLSLCHHVSCSEQRNCLSLRHDHSAASGNSNDSGVFTFRC
jgi:hypothetical protein